MARPRMNESYADFVNRSRQEEKQLQLGCWEDAMLIRNALVETQICVPEDWTNQQVEDAIKKQNTRLEHGWDVKRVKRKENKKPDRCPERPPCQIYPNRIHIMLDET